MRRQPSGPRLARFGCAVLVAAFLASCDQGQLDPQSAQLVAAARQDADSFKIVDCKLPPQVRQLGQRATFLTAPRVIKASAGECEIRGGEYIAYDRANLSTEIAYWQPKAAEGDPKAQTYLGEIYERGLGGQKPDYESAALWYKRAAEQNYAPAQINLGQLYEQGLGVAKDQTAALNWYRKASGLGATFVASGDAAAEIASLRSRVAEQDQTQATLQAQLAEEQRRAAQEDSAREREVAAGRRERQELAAARAAVERERRELAEARREILPDSPDLTAERERLGAREAELAKLQGSLAAWQAEVGQREAMVAARERDQAVMADELAAARRQLAETEATLAQRQAALGREQQAATASTSDRTRVEELLAARQEELARLGTLLAARQAEVAAREQQLSAAQAGMAERAAAENAKVVQAVAQVRAELDAQQAELAAERRRLAATEATLAEREREVAAKDSVAEQRLAALAARERELEAKEDGLGEREAQLAALDARIQTVSAETKTQIEALAGMLGGNTTQVAANDVAATQPEITLLDPTLDNPTRTGVPVVRVRSNQPTRTVVGRVTAPKKLVSLTVNDARLPPDATGLFTVEVPLLRSERTEVEIVAVDAAAGRGQLKFALQPESMAGGTTVASADQLGALQADLPKLNTKGIDFGRYYALVIGNNGYRHLSKLETAQNDARQIARTLEDEYGFQVKLLLDASRYDILSALNELREKLTDHDNLLIYYAGHGTLDDKNQRGYWLPVDAEETNNANWISNVDITDMLNAMNAKRILVIADSCYSGTLTRSSQARLEAGMTAEARRAWVETVAKKRSRVALTSGGLTPVLDAGGGGNSVFARALLDVLHDNKDVLNGEDIYREVTVRVAYAADAVQFEQVPQYAPIRYAGHESGEFFLVPRGAS